VLKPVERVRSAEDRDKPPKVTVKEAVGFWATPPRSCRAIASTVFR
jgi:hypothetical protein